MTEKIKELAERVLIYATENGYSDACYRPNGYLASVSSAFADTFAELIIQECMDNLSFHGYDDAVKQLDYFRITKFGVK